MGNIKFAIIGHRAPSKGELSLNDLAGSGGRMDVLVRAVNAALFLSHGMRNNVDVILHLNGSTGRGRRVLFEGENLRGLHADERSIAGHIAKLIRNPIPPSGNFVEISPGLLHTGGGIKDTLNEWNAEGVIPYCMDAMGEPFGDIVSIGTGVSFGFVLSDDQPFTIEEQEFLTDNTKSISIGNKWLQGHSVIAIIHYLLDHQI